MAAGHIVIYEPRRLVREGLASFLGQEYDVVACGDVADLHSMLRAGATTGIISLEGAHEPLWRALAMPLKARRSLRLIGVASVLDAATIRRARSVGMREVVSSEAGLQGVLDALATRAPAAMARGGPLRVVSSPAPELTRRERDVVQLIARGLTAQQIADELRISVKTVENHKQRVFRKLDVQSQSHAVAVALRHGLLRNDFEQEVSPLAADSS